MGYRSYVKMLFTGDHEDVTAFIARAKLELGGEYFDWPDSKDVGSRYWLVEWNSVKWYDIYNHVRAWGALFESCRTEDSPIGAEFMRVGEDDDDLEHDITHDGDRNMWISRQIEVDI